MASPPLGPRGARGALGTQAAEQVAARAASPAAAPPGLSARAIVTERRCRPGSQRRAMRCPGVLQRLAASRCRGLFVVFFFLEHPLMGGLPQLPRTWLLSFPPATRVTQLSLLCRVCQWLVPCLGVFAAFWLARWLGGFTTLLSQHLPSGWDPQGTEHRSFPFLPLCMASPQIIWVPEVIPGCLLMPSPAALGLQLQRCIFHQCSGRSPPADPTLHFLLVPRTQCSLTSSPPHMGQRLPKAFSLGRKATEQHQEWARR